MSPEHVNEVKTPTEVIAGWGEVCKVPIIPPLAETEPKMFICWNEAVFKTFRPVSTPKEVILF